MLAVTEGDSCKGRHGASEREERSWVGEMRLNTLMILQTGVKIFDPFLRRTTTP